MYAVVFALSSVVYGTNAGMARDSADTIIVALHIHRDENGRYPERLSSLVPGHLPSIPSAAPLLLVDRWFRYRRAGRGFELSYDFGFLVERVYDSATESWSVRE